MPDPKLQSSSQSDPTRTPAVWLQRMLPVAVVATMALWLVMTGARLTGPAPDSQATGVRAFGAIPVSEDGRVKPLDSVARNALLQLSGKQSLVEEMWLGDEAHPQPAIYWLAEVVARHPRARQRPVFRIDDPDLLGLMNKTVDDGKYYSLDQLLSVVHEIEPLARAAQDVPDDERSRFQEHLLALQQNIGLFFELEVGLRPYVLPPTASEEEWQPISELGLGEQLAMPTRATHERPTALSWREVLVGFRAADPQAFGAAVARHRASVEEVLGDEPAKASFEQWFNAFRPFVSGVVLYLLAGVLGLLGLLFRPMLSPGWARSFWRSGMGLLVLAFALHTGALLVRMWLQGRPPVTNLYSSAVFIGWAAVGFALVIELISRLGMASLAASCVGVGTLIIAHGLSKDGDTMGVMQAVLDSNFWLGTHVITVTLGYAATFFAGFLALLYIVLGMGTPLLDKPSARQLSTMVYAVVCFALLFSFVGTVLGGIWADQSWGRFWGWDPKENGAIMIVVMNAIILHARWGHLVRDRGLMVLAVGGNIVTAWSWFGTNLLGVGLHSYGFMDGAMVKLGLFVAANLAVIIVALAVPTRYWWSFSPKRKNKAPA